MFYFGCIFLLFIVIVMMVLSLVRNAFGFVFNVIYGAWLSARDWWHGLFRPTPVESEIEDMNYYHETEERPKLYEDEDGEYTSFKELD